jgi:hypothetical protein
MAERELKECTMKPIDLIAIIVGIAAIILGQIFKGAETLLTGIGAALAGMALPQFSRWSAPTKV